MNAKRNQGIIVFVGLSIAAWAYAQMGLSNNGVVFPDGSVQTTAAAGPGTITEYRIVGSTSDATYGQIVTNDATELPVTGYSAMNLLCEAKFGPGARAAFTNEDIAPGIAPNDILAGWIRPTNITVIYSPEAAENERFLAYDTYSGAAGQRTAFAFSARTALHCNHYRSTNAAYGGIVMFPNAGFFEVAACDSTYRILCSAPVVITNSD